MEITPMTPAGKLYALVNKLKAERDGLAKVRVNAEAASIERASSFDEDSARRELGRAVALDAVEGTDTADEIAKRHDAERARVTKETSSVQKRREKAQAELADLDRREADLDVQISEAETLLVSEIAREGRALAGYAAEQYVEAAQELIKAAARLHAAQAMAHHDLAHERDPQPFVIMVPTFWHSGVEIPGGVDLGRGLIEIAEDVTGPMVRDYHKTMLDGLLGTSVPDRAAA
jgi:hypothetical protein